MKNRKYYLFLQTAANAALKNSKSERIPSFFTLHPIAACEQSGNSSVFKQTLVSEFTSGSVSHAGDNPAAEAASPEGAVHPTQRPAFD